MNFEYRSQIASSVDAGPHLNEVSAVFAAAIGKAHQTASVMRIALRACAPPLVRSLSGVQVIIETQLFARQTSPDGRTGKANSAAA